MKIEFDVLKDTPLAVADAIIERENAKGFNDLTMSVARENIRQIGQALTNYVWSCERLDRECEER